jgi:hypothetical protein
MIGKYKIKYNYDTGDTFHTDEGCEDFLELTWDILDVAKQNLVRIREHYEQYRKLNSLSYSGKGKTYKDITGENQSKDWFVKDGYEHCLKLYGDNGEVFQICAPWCGYFERLNWCEIEVDNSDMKINF